MAIREVVTATIDDHPALASTLERGLIEERENQIQGLMSAKDWPDFEKRRGLVNKDVDSPSWPPRCVI